MSPPRRSQGKLLRYQCPVCDTPRSVGRKNMWCQQCCRLYREWRAVVHTLGIVPRPPPDIREYRLALYQWRLENDLPLFDQPLNLPIRD